MKIKRRFSYHIHRLIDENNDELSFLLENKNQFLNMKIYEYRLQIPDDMESIF